MDNKTKKEYLQMLNNDKFYNHALVLVGSDAERKKIKAFAEEMFVKLMTGTTTIQKITNEHHEKLVEVAEGKVSRDKESPIVKDK